MNHIGNIYTREHLVTKQLNDYHVKLLTSYKHDETNSDIQKVAKLDEEYADIVGVLDHKIVPPNSEKRTDLNFLWTWDNDMGKRFIHLAKNAFLLSIRFRL